jgi:uncharacterized protein YgfB (UPF0149 family)
MNYQEGYQDGYHDGAAPGDFDELGDWLLTLESRFSPAELHGAIVGGLCGAMRLSSARWAQFGLAVMGASSQMQSQFGAMAEITLGGLAQQQLAILASDDLAFKPFLPDDDEAIEQRTDSLSDWCKGFLGGFAEAQVFLQKQDADEGEVDAEAAAQLDRSLPENVQEALSDLAAIAQASVSSQDDDGEHDDFDDMDEDDPLGMGLLLEADTVLTEDGEEYQYDSGDAEAAERDYTEIVEYLRLATMTVFTEFGWIEMLSQPAVDPQPGAASLEASIKAASSPTGAARFFKPGNKTMH